jgi:hypothetical protein
MFLWNVKIYHHVHKSSHVFTNTTQLKIPHTLFLLHTQTGQADCCVGSWDGYYGFCLFLSETKHRSAGIKMCTLQPILLCYKEAAVLNKHIYGIKQNKQSITVSFSIFVWSRYYYCPCRMTLEPCHIRTVGLVSVPNFKKVVSSGNASDLNFTRDTNYVPWQIYFPQSRHMME